MPIHNLRSYLWFAAFVVFACILTAQTHSSPPQPAHQIRPDYSGMYSFLRDGEFVQLNIEERGRVTGFVSRYGNTGSDRGVFLDHFFKGGKAGDASPFFDVELHELAIAQETVHAGVVGPYLVGRLRG